MRIMFVACYFPPMNSTGARRVTAFARHLAARGHDVVVVTPTKRPAHGALTEPMPDGVRVLEIPRPTRVSSTPDGRQSTPGYGSQRSRSGLLGRGRALAARLVLRLLGQLADRELIFVRDLLRDPRVREEARLADVLVSTSPPWVTHLGARLLSRRSGTPWVADYRDQFSRSQFSQGTRSSHLIEVALDRWLVQRSRATVVVSRAMQDYYAKWTSSTHLIYNGFEPDRVSAAVERAAAEHAPREELVLRYVGTYVAAHPPREFLEALRELPSDRPVRFEAVGRNTDLLAEYVRRAFPELAGMVVCRPQVSADMALQLMADADCLVVLETWQRSADSQRGVATTKIFEYLAVRRPIVIAASPDIEAAFIARDAGLLVAASIDPGELCGALKSVASGRFHPALESKVIDGFSRPHQAAQLEQVLEDVVASARIDASDASTRQ